MLAFGGYRSPILPTISILAPENSERLTERFGEETIRGLSAEEMTANAFAEQHGQVTNGDLQSMLALHRSDITTLLKGLQSRGLLEKEGDRRGTSYHLPSSPAKDPSSPAKDPSSPAKDPSSPAKDPSSPDSDPDSSIHRLQPPANANASRCREETNLIVVQFCLGDFQQVSTIAQQLGRDEKYVRDEVIPELVRDGYLVSKYPDTPTHPNQAYKASREQ